MALMQEKIEKLKADGEAVEAELKKQPRMIRENSAIKKMAELTRGQVEVLEMLAEAVDYGT